MISVIDVAIALLQSIAPLTTVTVDDDYNGIYVAGELPAALANSQDAPTCVVVEETNVGTDIIVPGRVAMRCYGPDQFTAKTLYNHVVDALYHPNGLPRGPRLLDGRWWLFGATLAGGRTTIEPDGWPVASGTLELHIDPQER